MAPSHITIHTHLDFICSWCYITHHNLLLSLSHHLPSPHSPRPLPQITLHHHPVYIDPYAPPFGIPCDAYMSGRQGPLKSNIAHQRIERIAAESGLRINTDGLIGHTRRAHRLVWYVRRVMPGKEAEVVERLFRLFWGEGGDVTSRGQLARVAGMVGLELEEVEGWLGGDEGADEVDGEAEEWIRERESGEKRGVPFSVVVSVEDDGAERRVVVGESKSVEQWSEILRDVMAG